MIWLRYCLLWLAKVPLARAARDCTWARHILLSCHHHLKSCFLVSPHHCLTLPTPPTVLRRAKVVHSQPSYLLKLGQVCVCFAMALSVCSNLLCHSHVTKLKRRGETSGRRCAATTRASPTIRQSEEADAGRRQGQCQTSRRPLAQCHG